MKRKKKVLTLESSRDESVVSLLSSSHLGDSVSKLVEPKENRTSATAFQVEMKKQSRYKLTSIP